MDSYAAKQFFNNFTNLFTSTEKTDNTPILSSFHSLSERNTGSQNINIQKHALYNDSVSEKDLKTMNVSRPINSRMTSETEVLIDPEVECNNDNNLKQRSSLEQLRENNVDVHIHTSVNGDKVKIQDTPTLTEKEFLDMDLQGDMIQGNSTLIYQGGQRFADGQADLQSNAFSQEYNDAVLSNTAGAAESHRCGNLPDCISTQTAEGLLDKVMRDSSTTNITNEEVFSTAQYEGKCQQSTNEVKHTQTKTQEPNELYTESPFQTSSTETIDLISTLAISDQAGKAMSSNGVFGTDTKYSDTGNKMQPKEDFWNSLIQDTHHGHKVESGRQSSSETADTSFKVKSDQLLLKFELASPGILSETQNGRETKDLQELSKLEMKKNGEQDRVTMKKHESDNLVQVEGESKDNAMKEENKKMLQDNSNSEFYGVPTVHENQEEPPNTENSSRLTRRVTFSPNLKLQKPPQLPSIFTGMKGLKKEMHDHQKKSLTLEQPKIPVVMNQASVKRELFSEEHPKNEVKVSILEQLSQLLSFDTSKVAAKKTQEPIASPPLSPSSEAIVIEMPSMEESVEDADVASPEESSKLTNKESALDAFKAFFTAKPAKRDTSDMDPVKRAFNTETIRAIFDRNSSKSPDNKNIFDKSPSNDERTPGRLQAIWPPPKPKDKDEKIGLKYTELEHQTALLQLKRECKEELESLEADFKLQFYHLREENEEAVSRLQIVIVDLEKAAKSSHGELRDVAVSTEDNITPRIFRNVCIQTDRETFIKPVEKPELSKDHCHQPNVPKKLDLASISQSLLGKQEPVLVPLPPPPPPLPPLPPPLSSQAGFDNVTSSTPSPSLPSPSGCYSKPAQSDQCPKLTQINGPPPPPPPPPAISAGLSPPPSLPGPVPFTHTHGGWLLSRAQERPYRKPRVEPICPMKPLYWTRIQIQDCRNYTLWNLLKEPAIINTNEFAELFAKMASPTKRKPMSEADNKTAKAKQIIKVLDSKRSQAVGILISSLHLEMKDIQQAILMMDNSVVDLDTTEALYENRAQPEELARIRKHYETSDEEHVRLLDKPEQFLHELSRIPQFSLRARCLILKSTFTDAVASIQHKTNMVLQVCKGLLERNSVREVLGLILAFGNYMNGGSRNRGQADGFELEILPKLKDVKSRDNRISLVDYVVSYYLRNLDKNAGTENCVFPLPEPQDVFLASQVKFEDLSRELRKLRKDLEGCVKDVQRVCLKSSQEYIHPFKEKMEAFLSSAQEEQISTEHHLGNAQQSFHDLVQYFGLKPSSGEKDVLPGHVFLLWFEFCNDFKTRWKRENKAISKERLKEAQQSVHNITADKKVETRQAHASGLKERLRLKEASLSST